MSVLNVASPTNYILIVVASFERCCFIRAFGILYTHFSVISTPMCFLVSSSLRVHLVSNGVPSVSGRSLQPFFSLCTKILSIALSKSDLCLGRPGFWKGFLCTPRRLEDLDAKEREIGKDGYNFLHLYP